MCIEYWAAGPVSPDLVIEHISVHTFAQLKRHHCAALLLCGLATRGNVSSYLEMT